MPLTTNRSPGRNSLQDGQVSKLVILDRNGGGRRVVLTTTRLIEAPNWKPDGKWLVVNGGGKLYRVRTTGGDLEEIFSGAVQSCNNDHVLSPDGTQIYVSSAGHLYVLPITGGEPRRLSNEHVETADYRYLYYLHGIFSGMVAPWRMSRWNLMAVSHAVIEKLR